MSFLQQRQYHFSRSLKSSLVTQLVKNLPEMWETWVGKIPWRRERLLTSVFWLEEFHGPYSPWGHKELDMTEQLSRTHKCFFNPHITQSSSRVTLTQPTNMVLKTSNSLCVQSPHSSLYFNSCIITIFRAYNQPHTILTIELSTNSWVDVSPVILAIRPGVCGYLSAFSSQP